VRLDKRDPPDVAMEPREEPAVRRPPPVSPPLPANADQPFSRFEVSPETARVRAAGREERTRAVAIVLLVIAVLALVAVAGLAWIVL
jgi:hypothetical protein